jgi:uncharacterized protein (TIGR02145 family)
VRVIFVLLFLCEGILVAQSKNDQVNFLMKKVDSLSIIIDSERKINEDKINQLTTKLAEKDRQLKSLELQLNPIKSSEVSSSSSLNSQFKSQKIGKQIWMTENLNVSTFRNGDTIFEAKTDEEWVTAGKQGRAAWCFYNNEQANGIKYGKIYNWFAVSDPRGLAPIGWKIPEFEDFNILDTYLWGDVGLKLKSASGWKPWNVEGRCKACSNWNEELRKSKHCAVCNDSRISVLKTNPGIGTNSSGFGALPCGFRNANGQFERIGEQANLWSSTSQYSLYGRFRYLTNQDSDLIMNYALKELGMAVRCLKE